MLFKALCRHFSKNLKGRLESMTYQEMVDTVAREYSFKEFQNDTGLCLLEMQHEFRLLRKGAWVLDLGAGPSYTWTDLALQLTRDQTDTHKVVSNDVLDLKFKRSNNVFIRGNFTVEGVATNIAIETLKRQFDVILVDSAPQFSGSLGIDAFKLTALAENAIKLSFPLLRPGGSIVCKMLQSDALKKFKSMSTVLFKESITFTPSVVHRQSPACYEVMRGFLMNPSHQKLIEFKARYAKAIDSILKGQIVQQYTGKYDWDPKEQIMQMATKQAMEMKINGHSDEQLRLAFANHPYLIVDQFLSNYNQMRNAVISNDKIGRYRAASKLTGNKLFTEFKDVPTNLDQKIKQLEGKLATQQNKKMLKNAKPSRAPLAPGEIFMRKAPVADMEETSYKYEAGDLEGNYSRSQITSQASKKEATKILENRPDLKNEHLKAKDTGNTTEKFLRNRSIGSNLDRQSPKGAIKDDDGVNSLIRDGSFTDYLDRRAVREIGQDYNQGAPLAKDQYEKIQARSSEKRGGQRGWSRNSASLRPKASRKDPRS